MVSCSKLLRPGAAKKVTSALFRHSLHRWPALAAARARHARTNSIIPFM